MATLVTAAKAPTATDAKATDAKAYAKRYLALYLARRAKGATDATQAKCTETMEAMRANATDAQLAAWATAHSMARVTRILGRIAHPVTGSLAKATTEATDLPPAMQAQVVAAVVAATDAMRAAFAAPKGTVVGGFAFATDATDATEG